MNEDNRQTATQAEPDEIARRFRLERIERAVKLFLESERTQDAMWRAIGDIKIAYYAPPMPPPDEPRLTRMELIALTEDAEQYLAESAYKDEYEREKRQRAESRAAIAKARDLIARGEGRLYPERFALAPEPASESRAERILWLVNKLPPFPSNGSDEIKNKWWEFYRDLFERVSNTGDAR